MVQRIIYTDTRRDDVERILDGLEFGEYQSHLGYCDVRLHIMDGSIMVSTREVGESDLRFVTESSRTRIHFHDDYGPEGRKRECQEFSQLGCSIYLGLTSQTENNIPVDPSRHYPEATS